MQKNQSIWKRLFNNFGLKIGSLVFAILLWLLVTVFNDPISSVQFSNIQVRLLHTSMITDTGNVYTVLDGTDVIPIVTVMGNRSIVDSLNADNIIATADVANITAENTIEIRLSSNKYSNELTSISGSIVNVRLAIEKRKTSHFALRTSTSGMIADGYYLGEVTPEQNQVRITGPESIVSQVASAGAVVDVSGATGNINTYADIRLYDADGDEVDKTNLTLNISQVKVSVSVMPIRDIPIGVIVSGIPAPGYVQSSVILSSPSSVELAGRAAVLSGVERITIPMGVVDITDASEDVVKEIDIRDYLPEYTIIADEDFDGMVTITVGIEEAVTRTIEISRDSVSLVNIPEGYEAELAAVYDSTGTPAQAGPDYLPIYLQGPQDELDTVDPAQLQPTADVSAILEQMTAEEEAALEAASAAAEEVPEEETGGEQQGEITFPIEVVLSMPPHVSQVNRLTARVRIVRTAEAEEEEESGT